MGEQLEQAISSLSSGTGRFDGLDKILSDLTVSTGQQGLHQGAHTEIVGHASTLFREVFFTTLQEGLLPQDALAQAREAYIDLLRQHKAEWENSDPSTTLGGALATGRELDQAIGKIAPEDQSGFRQHFENSLKSGLGVDAAIAKATNLAANDLAARQNLENFEASDKTLAALSSGENIASNLNELLAATVSSGASDPAVAASFADALQSALATGTSMKDAISSAAASARAAAEAASAEQAAMASNQMLQALASGQNVSDIMASLKASADQTVNDVALAAFNETIASGQSPQVALTGAANAVAAARNAIALDAAAAQTNPLLAALAGGGDVAQALATAGASGGAGEQALASLAGGDNLANAVTSANAATKSEQAAASQAEAAGGVEQTLAQGGAGAGEALAATGGSPEQVLDNIAQGNTPQTAIASASAEQMAQQQATQMAANAEAGFEQQVAAQAGGSPGPAKTVIAAPAPSPQTPAEPVSIASAEPAASTGSPPPAPKTPAKTPIVSEPPTSDPDGQTPAPVEETVVASLAPADPPPTNQNATPAAIPEPVAVPPQVTASEPIEAPKPTVPEAPALNPALTQEQIPDTAASSQPVTTEQPQPAIVQAEAQPSTPEAPAPPETPLPTPTQAAPVSPPPAPPLAPIPVFGSEPQPVSVLETVRIQIDETYEILKNKSEGQATQTSATVTSNPFGNDPDDTGLTAAEIARIIALRPPVSEDVAFDSTEDSTYNGSLKDFASDESGDDLAFSIQTDPLHGSVVLTEDGQFTYSPDENFNGIDSFTYLVTDSDGKTSSSTVEMTLEAVNDTPEAQSGNGSGDEDNSISGSLVATDVDGDDLSFALANGPSHGSLVVNEDGSYTYTPNENYNGEDSFTYTVSDGAGDSATQTISLTISVVNDDPQAQAGSGSGDEDNSISGSLVATDVDGDDLSFAIAVDPLHGTLTINTNGSYTYTPNENYFGTDSFTYTVSDGAGGTARETILLTVEGVNDAPTDLELENASIAEEIANGTVVGTVTTTDPDNSSGFTYTLLDDGGDRFAIDANTGVITVDDQRPDSLDDVEGLVMWLDPNSPDTLTRVGVVVGRIDDRSDADNDAFQGNASHRPDLVENAFADGSSGLQFDGVDDYLLISDDSTLNLGSHTDRSYFIRFRTGDDVASRQILFEEGGVTNGTNVYIDGGELYLSFYTGGFSGYFDVNGQIEANTEYLVGYVFDGATQTLEGFLDGVSMGSVDVGRGNLPSHADNIGLGGLNQNAVFHDGAVTASTGFNFEGIIGELGLFNGALLQDELIALGDTNPNIFDATNEPSVDIVVQVTDPDGASYNETVSIGVAGQNIVANGSFEDPGQASGFGLYHESLIPGWETTQSGDQIEIWADGFLGFDAPDGSSFIEGNANSHGTLFQTIDVVAGREYDWSFYHQGRSGEDTVQLTISETATPSNVENFGNFTTGNSGWQQYSGTYTVPDGVTQINLNFTTISTSSGSASSGNLLDDVHFGLAAPASAEAASLASYAQTSGSDFAALLDDDKEDASSSTGSAPDQSFTLDQDQDNAGEQIIDVV